MAISNMEYQLIKTLRKEFIIPTGGSILELGEANWYGDVNLNTLAEDIYNYAPIKERGRLLDELKEIYKLKKPSAPFDIARVWYKTFLSPKKKAEIDLDGQNSYRLDLNNQIDLDEKFNLVINFGTAEHIFNICQFFKNVHDLTLPGGLMIHGCPFKGWIDHGFYNINPTLFWDLANSNSYDIAYISIDSLNPKKSKRFKKRDELTYFLSRFDVPNNSNIYVVFVKAAVESAFQIPMQGYYNKEIDSHGLREAWDKLKC